MTQEPRPGGRMRWAIVTLDLLVNLTLLVTVVQAFQVVTGCSLLSILANGSDVWVPPEALPQLTQFEYEGPRAPDGRVTVAIFPLPVRVLGASSFLLGAAMVVLLLRTARLLAIRVAGGTAFSTGMSTALRRVAWVVPVLAIARLLVDVLTTFAVGATLPEDFTSLGVGYNVPMVPFAELIGAVVAGVLAIAFSRAEHLEEETVGLV